MNSIMECVAKVHPMIRPLYAKGSRVWTKNASYLDMTSGIGVMSLGHCNEELNTYVKHQIDHIVHTPQQVYQSSQPMLEFHSRMLDTVNTSKLTKIFHVNSGSEATDNALKLARMSTGKANIIALNGGFHGRTIGAMSVTSSNIMVRKGCGPLLPSVFFCDPTKESLDNVLGSLCDPIDTAAFICESIQGEGGIQSISAEFLQYTRKVCNEHGILMIADEVQCGTGRTGYYWNIMNKGVIPDIMLYGKGIASGWPMAGVITTDHVVNKLNKGCLGGTYGGNAMVCAAAAKTLEIIERDNIMDNVQQRSSQLGAGIGGTHGVADVRIHGLMCGIDFNNNIRLGDVVDEFRNNNILVLTAGKNTLRLLPPLIISEKEINEFIEVFKNLESLKVV